MSGEIECAICRCVIPASSRGCPECGACTQCQGDEGASCPCWASGPADAPLDEGFA